MTDNLSLPRKLAVMGGAYGNLAALASSAGIDPGRTELHSLEGDAAATLLALAASSEADLLCAGRLGASPLRDLLLGSVSEKLLQLSPCPLLLAH